MPRRRLSWLLAVIATTLIAAPAAAATPATVALAFSPFAADGTLSPGLRATPAFGGSCDSGSFVVSGETAFRCSVGDVIRDPCFADLASSTGERAVVVCVASPWAQDVVRLRVRGALNPQERAAPGGPPWALQLASGRRCVVLQGARPVVADRRMSYGCGADRFLFGSPDRSAATWRIRQGSGPRGAQLRKVAIATAWS